MKVCVIPGHYSYGKGVQASTVGFGRNVRLEACALANRGHEVTLLYVHFDAKSGVTVEEISDEGVRCVYVHARPLPLPVNLLYRVALMLWAFQKFILSTKPDVIHAHSYRAGIFARPISPRCGIPYVITEHSPLRHRRISRLWALVAKWSYSGAAQVITVSDGLADTLREFTENLVRVIPNLVRSDFLSATLPRKRDPSLTRPYRFLSVGRTDPIKGWDLLIRAFSDLVNDNSNAALELVGGGKELSNIKDLAAQLNVIDHVSFSGHLEHDAVLARIMDCDCHVLSSRAETFGIVSIEALALGKPIIMTPTSAAHVIVNDANGIIAPTHEAGDLAYAMRQVMGQSARYNAENIRADCHSRFSAESVCRMLGEMYEEVVNHHRLQRIDNRR